MKLLSKLSIKLPRTIPKQLKTSNVIKCVIVLLSNNSQTIELLDLNVTIGNSEANVIVNTRSAFTILNECSANRVIYTNVGILRSFKIRDWENTNVNNMQ